MAVYHLKGGVGKTATAVNLAYLGAASGLRTLVCDLDPQSSATYYFRVRPRLKNAGKVYLKGRARVSNNIKGTDYDRLDLLPADWSHRHLASALGRVKRSRKRLQEIFAPFRGEYDLIVLDSPATATLLAESIFVAADLLLVPVVPSTLAARAYANLRAFIKRKGLRRRQGMGVLLDGGSAQEDAPDHHGRHEGAVPEVVAGHDPLRCGHREHGAGAGAASGLPAGRYVDEALS